MKSKWKWILSIVFGIPIIFTGIYVLIRAWPSTPSFGIAEIIFIVLILVAIFIVIKVVSRERKERKAKKEITDVINNKSLLLEKLNHPELEIDGKKEKIKRIIDMGQKLNVGINPAGEVEINHEKIEIKSKPEPVKSIPKKKVSAKKKTGKKK